MSISQERIPSKILLDAQAIAIIPNLIQGGFILGARYGEGVLLLKDSKKGWSDPLFIRLYGGSLGWQIGFEAVEIVLIFPKKESALEVLKHKLVLGLDLSIAVGPIGKMKHPLPNIYSYARTMGVFAGLALAGSVLEVDYEANSRFYRCDPSKIPQILEGNCLKENNIVTLLKQKLQRYTSSFFNPKTFF
ncbi:MAG: lipid-binding SYLF domain-containing protein [Epsilonproteobacteria bacterium]|nr:lipid-binding SYLF domain-containing protein [Campylobacterota bacterium]